MKTNTRDSILEAGADIISSGSLTSSVDSLDFSLEIILRNE